MTRLIIEKEWLDKKLDELSDKSDPRSWGKHDAFEMVEDHAKPLAELCRWTRFIDDVDVQGEDRIVSWAYKTCKSEMLEKDWENIEGEFCPDCGKRIGMEEVFEAQPEKGDE